MFLFENKKEYIQLMKKGTKEGIRWYRDERDSSNS